MVRERLARPGSADRVGDCRASPRSTASGPAATRATASRVGRSHGYGPPERLRRADRVRRQRRHHRHAGPALGLADFRKHRESHPRLRDRLTMTSNGCWASSTSGPRRSSWPPMAGAVKLLSDPNRQGEPDDRKVVRTGSRSTSTAEANAGPRPKSDGQCSFCDDRFRTLWMPPTRATQASQDGEPRGSPQNAEALLPGEEKR